MNIPRYLTALTIGILAFNFSLFAQTANTNPVGYVTFNVNPNSDIKLGVPLTQPPVFTGVVSGVATGIVSTSGTIPDVTTDAHFIWITSGTLEGQWYTITASDAGTITVQEDLAGLGLASNHAFTIVPFWTLDSLFPNGGTIPTAPSPSNIQGSIFLNDLSATGINLAPAAEYVYFEDPTGNVPVGWYDLNNPGAGTLGNTPITPSSFFTIRNNTGNSFSVTFSGSTPVAAISNTVISSSTQSQDNQLYNFFPVGLTLGAAGFIESGAVKATANPFTDPSLDSVFVYSSNPTSINSAPAIEFVYIDDPLGSVPTGWYDINNPGAGVQDNYLIDYGVALIIRRGVDSDNSFSWKAPLPY